MWYDDMVRVVECDGVMVCVSASLQSHVVMTRSAFLLRDSRALRVRVIVVP